MAAPSAEAAQLMRWKPNELDAWISGEQAFDEKKAIDLANLLDLDCPTFVGKAHEVTLRRELAK